MECLQTLCRVEPAQAHSLALPACFLGDMSQALATKVRQGFPDSRECLTLMLESTF